MREGGLQSMTSPWTRLHVFWGGAAGNTAVNWHHHHKTHWDVSQKNWLQHLVTNIWSHTLTNQTHIK